MDHIVLQIYRRDRYIILLSNVSSVVKITASHFRVSRNLNKNALGSAKNR